jgi:hypothetical protein
MTAKQADRENDETMMMIGLDYWLAIQLAEVVRHLTTKKGVGTPITLC